MDLYYYLAAGVALTALLATAIFARQVMAQAEGTERMKETAAVVRDGANALLWAEYKILVVFIAVAFAAIAVVTGFLGAAVFSIGAVSSIPTDFFGMNIVTRANVRIVNVAKEYGMRRVLATAPSGGAVTGLTIAGLDLLGVEMLYYLVRDPNILFDYSLGVFSIALFARVGGGIYIKTADVGVDLAGKVEAGIPEDDSRNPAVTTNNTGDNVGDVADMGVDLFESYSVSIVSAISLGLAVFGEEGALLPLPLAAVSIFASVIGIVLVRLNKHPNPKHVLDSGTYFAGGVMMAGALLPNRWLFGGLRPGIAAMSGLLADILVGTLTEVYTSAKFGSAKKIVRQPETGLAANTTSGITVEMTSVAVPLLAIYAAIFVSHTVGGLYGTALAALEMLSTTGITVAVDVYGPIADNVGGIAEMSGLDSSVHEIIDQPDATGNTTVAIGKGFAIGSAALAVLSLFVSYAEAVDLTSIGILELRAMIGLLISGTMPFLSFAFTMEPVGKAVFEMTKEARCQFHTMSGIMSGNQRLDYKKCVAISTRAVLKEMFASGLIAILTPVAMSLVFGVQAPGGTLAGALVMSVMMAIFMVDSGGAWNDTKEYIKQGQHGGKGSAAHKAAVVGDTAGDPLKDASGPAFNTLIRLTSIIALACALFFLSEGCLL